jgi:hypothetical protein
MERLSSANTWQDKIRARVSGDNHLAECHAIKGRLGGHPADGCTLTGAGRIPIKCKTRSVCLNLDLVNFEFCSLRTDDSNRCRKSCHAPLTEATTQP